MILQDKIVAIVGGGPGGLTLARLLQNKGVNVKVYERDANRNVRVQGATLDLHYESGLRALEEAGLLDAFKATYRPGNDLYRVVNKDAVILHDDHKRSSTGDFGDEWFRPEIDRGPLRDMLLDSLHPDTVAWDSHIVTLEKMGDGWNIIFKNGTKAYADVVIGADGANSKIRKIVTPIEAKYSGVTYLVGNIPNLAENTPKINALLKGGKVAALEDSRTIFLSAKGDGSLDFYICWKTGLNWAAENSIDLTNIAQVSEWFNTEFKGWGGIWQELFTYQDIQFILRPLYGVPPDQHWEAQPNITLLGDAAHVLPPNGEGVNAAMLDALDLSICLTHDEFSDVPSAIAGYEKKMFARFVKDEKDTAEMMDWMFAPNGAAVMVAMFNEMPE